MSIGVSAQKVLGTMVPVLLLAVAFLAMAWRSPAFVASSAPLSHAAGVRSAAFVRPEGRLWLKSVEVCFSSARIQALWFFLVGCWFDVDRLGESLFPGLVLTEAGFESRRPCVPLLGVGVDINRLGESSRPWMLV